MHSRRGHTIVFFLFGFCCKLLDMKNELNLEYLVAMHPSVFVCTRI